MSLCQHSCFCSAIDIKGTTNVGNLETSVNLYLFIRAFYDRTKIFCHSFMERCCCSLLPLHSRWLCLSVYHCHILSSISTKNKLEEVEHQNRDRNTWAQFHQIFEVFIIELKLLLLLATWEYWWIKEFVRLLIKMDSMTVHGWVYHRNIHCQHKQWDLLPETETGRYRR